MSWLQMRDFLTLSVKETESNKKHLFECKDSESPTGKSMLVTVAATHSGIVTGNAKFYRPDRMQASAHTFTSAGKPARPVLINHDRNGECIGRIQKQRYVDLSYQYTTDGVKSLCFYDSSAKKLNLHNSVDWVIRNLHGKPSYNGLGYVELGLNVTDPAAIQKIQDGRYLTVSVGFGTDAAVCSICHTDWAVDDRCEHDPGHVYDGKPAFIIAGNFVYKEMSFVNFGADPWAAVTNKDSVSQIADSLANRVFFMGLSQEEQKQRFTVNGSLHLDWADSISFLGSDIQPAEDSEIEEQEDMDLIALQKEIKSKELTSDRAFAIRKELEDAQDRASVKRTLSSLNAKIRANNWTQVEAFTKSQVEAEIANLDAKLETFDEVGKAAYRAELEDRAAAFGLTLPEAPAEVKPEGTAAPVEPAAPAAPAPVTDETDQAMTALLQSEIDAAGGTKTQTFPGKSCAAALESLNKLHASIEDDDRWIFRSAISALMETWYSGSNLDYYKKRLMEKATDAVVSKTELDELHTAVESYEADVRKKENDNQALMTTNIRLVTDQKLTYARAIVAGSVLLGKKGFANLSADQIQTEISARAKRQLISLQDSLQDLLQELPGNDLQAASASNSNESAVREVSDNAKVEGEQGPTSGTDGTVAPATDQQDRDDQTAMLRLCDPVIRRQAVARANYRKKHVKSDKE